MRVVVEHLDAARAWYARVLGREPYFEAPLYVGFAVNDPSGNPWA